VSKKVAFHTLGCKLNFSESSTVLREFEERGWRQAKKGEIPDLVFFNTCTVTQSADSKSRKAIRQAVKKYPDAFVAVTGCFAQSHADRLAKIPGVDLILGMGEKFNIFKYLSSFEKQESPLNYASKIADVSNFDSAWSGDDRTRAFLKVQDGCDYVCSYCIIPEVRGQSRNKPVSELLHDVETIAQSGKKEIILTGVNIGDFGKSSGEKFYDLLKAIDNQGAVPRVRISSVEPNLLSRKIIDLTAASDMFLPHFHIPLQSGSAEILKKMKRPYTPELFAERIRYIKQIIPDAFLGIDVIVGFPGETDAHFRETLDFLKSLDLSFLHVFSYSDRPGTKASQSDQKIPSEIIKDRSNRLHELSDRMEMKFYKENIGQTRKVLFEAAEKDGYIFGFTDNYIKVRLPFSPDLPNTIHKVRITNANLQGLAEGVLDV
jgi:threonylcarbamoyladenosine tRNA methylthiotransferase MtaB